MSNLDILIEKIYEIESNPKYTDDLNKIKQININLNNVKNNIFSEESINDIEDDIRLLVYKYVELDDLENLFDDIKFILRKQIREKSVAKLREKMRK